MARKVKSTSRLGEHLLRQYEKSNIYTISNAYKTRVSYLKYRGEKECLSMMRKEGGKGYKILFASTFNFSCGWILPNGDLRVETRDNSYVVVD